MPKYPYAVSVRARLRRLGRTQKELAEALGYCPTYISAVLSGRVAAPELRRRITELLGKWEAEQ